MMAYDGQVVINTKLDDKGLKTGITGLQNTTMGALRKVKGMLATVGLGVGIAATVKGINNLVKSAAELTDRIDKQSQKLGMSRRAYQEWGFILSQNGADVDRLQTSVKTLSTVVDEAANGNKTYQQYLDRLKVSIYDANGAVKSQEQLFSEIFTALTKVESETERTNLATKLLGKSATDLAPALNAGAGSVEELRAKAHELNLVLDDAVVNVGVRLTDTLDKMRRSMQSASARAISPLMGYVDDMADAFTKNAIPAIEKFLTTAFKIGLSIPPIFSFMKVVVTTVLKEIGDALEEPWEKLKAFVGDLLNMPIVKNTIELVLDLAGDLWAGLKKGVQSGDWGDFWAAAVGAAQLVIGIGATIFLAEGAASAISIWASSQAALIGAGFSRHNLMAGAIAMASIGLAVVDAMENGEWTSLANNLTAALAAALIAGGLTRNPAVGAMAFSIALNFKLGESDIMSGLFGDPTEAAEKVKAFFQRVWDMTGLAKWWDDIGKEIGNTIIQGILNAFRLFDIVGAVVDLFNKTPVGKFLGMFDFVGGAVDLGKIINEKLYGTPIDLGNIPVKGDTQLANNVGMALVTSLKVAADEQTIRQTLANRLLPDSAKAELLMKSTEMGKQLVAGLKDGTDAGIKKYAKDNANAVLDIFRDVWGIHSPSDETTTMGHMLVQGLVNGLIEMFPELKAEAEKMRDALEKIWADGDYKPPVPEAGGSGGTSPPASGKTDSALSLGLGDFAADMKEKAGDWKGYFYESAHAFNNAFGNAFSALGQQLARQDEMVQQLGSSIAQIEKDLAYAYEDLESAQDDYAKAVLSGDSRAIKDAKRRLDLQQDLIKSKEDQLDSLKDEKRAIEDGSKAWEAFGKTALMALADVLEGLGAQLAAQAVTSLIALNFVGAALATAGSAAAFIASGVVRGYAGSYAEGGIVPGTLFSGDRLVANVNSGELILNAAQQDRIAAQLAMFARLTDLLSSMQFSSHGGINVDLRGSTFNDMSEEAVGKAIYRNVKSLQAEGVLPRW